LFSTLSHSTLSHIKRFFHAHRILAQHASSLGPGFWVRFTVHYNLCAGTVLELGKQDHLDTLHFMQTNGILGCFGLTERLAGVSSGLVAQTTADWDSSKQTFTLNTPFPGAAKNWISQGLCADKIVVVADLRIKNKSYGPHAFFTDLRKNGEVVPGVELGDMGRKTVGNDLDNAWISFSNVVIPKRAMLNRYADVNGDTYIQKIDGIPAFYMIGQRLFSGRVAVAQAALAFRNSVFEKTQSYADNKQCWAPKGTRALSSLPHLKSLFCENEKNLQVLNPFLEKCEADLCKVLRSRTIPSTNLVEAIAVAKVKVVEDSIAMVHRLQNEVGSFALMHGTGFEQRDYLTCCKFAEGDSRVLMQKMARDRFKIFQKTQLGNVGSNADEETQICQQLHEKLQNNPDEWDNQWQLVDSLSEAIMQRTIKEFMSEKK
jgi:acyl-CoA oxidase